MARRKRKVERNDDDIDMTAVCLGEQFTCFVRDGSYIYDGESYDSLNDVARHIQSVKTTPQGL